MTDSNILPFTPRPAEPVHDTSFEVARHAGAVRHRAGYHGLRAPGYLLQAVFWAQVGAVKLLFRWLHWWLFPVPREAHTDAASDGWRAWRMVFREHKETA